MASLWDHLVATTEQATRAGALITVPTEREMIEDLGIEFVVHITTLQKTKEKASRRQETETSVNPFLPPDPDLLVADLGPHHLGVLNKFNVLPHHLLIITRDFEPQEALLTGNDFTALLSAMNEIDGLGFYNGGEIAGASQSHKHLQLVPLPLGRGPLPTPIDSVLDATTETGDVTTVPAFDFRHALIPLDGAVFETGRAQEIHLHYRQACAAAGIHDESQPYNLLLTRRWMLLVPRSREHWSRVSLNALAFAGSLLVRNRTVFDRLREIGPLAVLKMVAEPGPL